MELRVLEQMRQRELTLSYPIPSHPYSYPTPYSLNKVELRVLEQMRQRELTHEMRNLSRKLTPAERKVCMQRRSYLILALT